MVKEWQAHVDHGESGGPKEPLMTATSLEALVAKMAHQIPAETRMLLARDPNASIFIHCVEVSN